MYTPAVDAAVSRFEMYHTATLLTSINPPAPHSVGAAHPSLGTVFTGPFEGCHTH